MVSASMPITTTRAHASDPATSPVVCRFAGADTFLIYLKARHDHVGRLIEATPPDDEAEIARLQELQEQLRRHMSIVPARTAAGAHAKLDLVADEFYAAAADGVSAALFQSALDGLARRKAG